MSKIGISEISDYASNISTSPRSYNKPGNFNLRKASEARKQEKTKIDYNFEDCLDSFVKKPPIFDIPPMYFGEEVHSAQGYWTKIADGVIADFPCYETHTGYAKHLNQVESELNNIKYYCKIPYSKRVNEEKKKIVQKKSKIKSINRVIVHATKKNSIFRLPTPTFKRHSRQPEKEKQILNFHIDTPTCKEEPEDDTCKASAEILTQTKLWEFEKKKREKEGRKSPPNGMKEKLSFIRDLDRAGQNGKEGTGTRLFILKYQKLLEQIKERGKRKYNQNSLHLRTREEKIQITSKDPEKSSNVSISLQHSPPYSHRRTKECEGKALGKNKSVDYRNMTFSGPDKSQGVLSLLEKKYLDMDQFITTSQVNTIISNRKKPQILLQNNNFFPELQSHKNASSLSPERKHRYYETAAQFNQNFIQSCYEDRARSSQDQRRNRKNCTVAIPNGRSYFAAQKRTMLGKPYISELTHGATGRRKIKKPGYLFSNCKKNGSGRYGKGMKNRTGEMDLGGLEILVADVERKLNKGNGKKSKDEDFNKKETLECLEQSIEEVKEEVNHIHHELSQEHIPHNHSHQSSSYHSIQQNNFTKSFTPTPPPSNHLHH